jgi:hypothetical protein
MNPAEASRDILAHFDGPAARRTARAGPVRGVAWVGRWFAALATVLLAASTLAHFGYRLGAELALMRVARAGLVEATLPRATYQSVSQTIERRLAAHCPRLSDQFRFTLQQNGAPVRGAIQPREGDVLSVTLAVPASASVPNWLRRLCIWAPESNVEVRAARRLPGRNLVES